MTRNNIIEEARKCYRSEVQPGIQIIRSEDKFNKTFLNRNADRKYFLVDNKTYFLMAVHGGKNFIISEKDYLKK